MEKQNPFYLQFEESLRLIKENLIKQQESTHTALESAEISRKSILKDLEEAKKNVEKTHTYFSFMNAINLKTTESNLIGKNATALATITSADAAAVVDSIGKAAKSVELASTSIAQMYSDAAAMQAKASSEDSKTEISKLADEAAVKSKEAAVASEQATIISLDTTIAAAQSNAGSVLAIVKVLAADIDALAVAIDKTTKSAKAIADKADATLTTSLTNEKSSELQVGSAKVNFESAKEANGADKIRIGLIGLKKEMKKQQVASKTN